MGIGKAVKYEAQNVIPRELRKMAEWGDDARGERSTFRIKSHARRWSSAFGIRGLKEYGK